MIDLYELGKDIGRLILKFRKKKPMEEKYFEPVTARSLAEKIVDKAQQFSPWQTRASQKNAIESIIEPHIRKPSDNKAADPNWIAKEIAAICLFRGEEGDSKFRRVRELVSPYIRTINELHQSKSVQERCEESYNEALLLLAEAADIMQGFVGTKEWLNKRRLFINKPNPFKEADIVKEDVDIYMDILEKERSQPKKYPFDLGLAAQGHKVVTRDDRGAKVVCDNLRGTDKPIAAVVTNTDGSKHGFTYSESGRHTAIIEHPLDLFILKEPETIEINIFRNKFDGTYSTSAYESKPLHGEELIKTIKTTI